ncbi:MAG: SDR family NAD(P)-dependent oxidoreductase [Acidobacteriota bacterium]|nr:SDR family NAD(P)-dependent oxidoreductase [Acidobacteriota bacterium]
MSPPPWTSADVPTLQGRSVIITGANSGIGRVAAGVLAGAGAAVTLAVRDVARGEAAAATMTGTVSVRCLDLADLGSVRSFAEATTGPVDILIDNAGVMAVPLARTADGFEMQIGTNHLGHFALTNLLLPLISERIVVVSSEMHRRGRIDLGDLNWQRRRYRAWDAYAQSKLANLLFVAELERRLGESGSSVRAVAVHPGYAATNLQSHTGRTAMSILMSIGNRLVAQSDTQGALPTLYGATMDIPGGAYVGPDGFQRLRGYPALGAPSARALDEATASRLWDLSEELTGVTFPLGPTR